MKNVIAKNSNKPTVIPTIPTDEKTTTSYIAELFNKYYQVQEGMKQIGNQIYQFSNQFGFEKAQIRADTYMFSHGYTKFRREKTIMITPAKYKFYYSTPEGKFIMIGVDASKEWEEWWDQMFKSKEEMWCSIADNIKQVIEMAKPNPVAENHLKEAMKLCGRN